MADDNSLVLAYEAYRHFGHLADDPDQPLWEVVRTRIAAGGRIAPADYAAALQRRHADMATFAAAMQGIDALLMPACDQAAQALDPADTRHTGLGKLLRPANFPVGTPGAVHVTVKAGPHTRVAADRGRIALCITLVVRSASQMAVVSTARNRSSSSLSTAPSWHPPIRQFA